MKFRLSAIVIALALSLVVWAQENPSASTQNATPKPETKSCCHHGADSKDAMSCCHHASADAKDAEAGCCGKGKCEMKDAKSCCGGKSMQACTKACTKEGGCKDGKCCGAAGEKSAMKCCGDKCERHGQPAAGN